MTGPRRKPGVARALEFLTAQLGQGLSTGHRRLPALRQLAQAADVSPVTMARAVAQLRSQGVLVTRPRGWIEAGPVTAPAVTDWKPPLPLPRTERWRGLHDAIARDIVGGVFAPGARLPSPKALMSMHGVGRRSVRAALALLVFRGVLARHGRTYRVPPPLTSRRTGCVVFIARGTPSGELFEFGGRTEELCRMLEDECHQAALTLEVAPYDYVRGRLQPSPATTAVFSPRGLRSVLGFFVWSSGILNPGPGRHDNITSLLARLQQYGKPIGVLDDSERRVGRPVGRRSARLLSVAPSMQGEEPGLAMGRYLLDLGHRHVAYLSAVHGSGWSQRRLAGLRQAFAAVGLASPVTAYTLDRARQPSDLGDYGSTQELVDLVARAAPTAAASPSVRAALRALAIAEPQLGGPHETAMLQEHMQALMRQALERRDVTAWVGANDPAALVCLEFLARQGVGVPEEVSVVGFDDSAPAFRKALTTYNFRVRAAVHAAFSHLLDPHGPLVGLRSGERVDIDGHVVVRRTTGRAPRAVGRDRPHERHGD